MQRYSHNAVSGDSPTHFKGDFSVILTKKAINSRKRLITTNNVHEIVPRKHCSSLPPMTYDQDFDSIKLSARKAVDLGIKDSIRHKSNFYQQFFDNLSNGFSKPSKEITFLQPIQKIVREHPSPLHNLKLQKSISKILETSLQRKTPEDIDPGNKLLANYHSESVSCKSPASTRVKFVRQGQPKLSRVNERVNSILISKEIKDFEKKLPKPVKNKGNLWYNAIKIISDL